MRTQRVSTHNHARAHTHTHSRADACARYAHAAHVALQSACNLTHSERSHAHDHTLNTSPATLSSVTCDVSSTEGVIARSSATVGVRANVACARMQSESTYACVRTQSTHVTTSTPPPSPPPPSYVTHARHVSTRDGTVDTQTRRRRRCAIETNACVHDDDMCERQSPL
jgi:hypothetical protein